MLVLLPPSETKRLGGSGALDPAALHAPEALQAARERVRAALVELSRDEEAAAKSLKLGVKNRGELDHNLRLGSSGVMPAIERYTGVLYDALDVGSLSAPERAWIDAHVMVQSALFGLVSAGDAIPAYRLSAGSRLPQLGAPLKRVWGEAHAQVSWAEGTLLLDLRSKDYGALAPLPNGYFLNVVQRGENGEVRALNHFNKAAKGDLVRRLARSGATPGGAEIVGVEELLRWSRDEGLEMTLSEADRSVTLVTELGAPARASSSGAVAR
ncbi:YaaA family protein [Leucobacter triazinivorans]|uniref:Peroxide stress protein YaaA n=1 Tax=Leucobacter triazinivorans TaxID=1784719 RepID=A0A4P6KJ80_9MICO|nr:peroxide stress protein YaaA [Leucobacter triazinivorans]QBE49654.1 peroxide stress protein YaaA [Leucobacter triazinivorans]